jgi:hypothetical protein
LPLASGSPATGAVYSATPTLPAGAHDFAFYVSDGTNAWSDPVTPGTYTGLTVSAKNAPLIRSKTRAPRPDNAPYAFDAG